jgi:sec-independent protein translocase protein TatB
MFDIAWSELLIIAIVALIFIGPKDLPKAMRTGARWMRAGQRLAREFQSHVDELVREAELEELREKARQATPRQFAEHIENVIDPKREIFEAMAQPPELNHPVMPPEPPKTEPGEPQPEQQAQPASHAG